MSEAYIYEFVTKWFGFRVKSIKMDATGDAIVWEGPWRWRRRAAYDDSMDHAYQAFSALFRPNHPTEI
jgi:hypothetical protein